MIPVLVAADLAGTLLLSDRTDARLRATQQTGAVVSAQGVAPTQNSVQFGFDLSNRPDATLDARNRYWDFRVEYEPSFTLTDLEQSFDLQVLNAGAATIQWHDRHVRLTLSEAGSYGQFNSAYNFGLTTSPGTGQNGQPATMGQQTTPGVPTSPQVAPAPVTITFISSTTTLRTDVQADKRTAFNFGGSYIVTGGINTIAYPETYGPRFDAGLTYAFSRRDQAVTNAYAQAAIFTTEQCISPSGVALNEFCHPEADVAQATEGLRHAFDPMTSLTLDAGAALSRTRQKLTDPFGFEVYPVAIGAFQHSYRGRDKLTLRVDAEYIPVIDGRSGYTASRIQGDFTFADNVAPHIRLTATATAAQTIPPSAPLAATLVSGQVSVDYLVSKILDVSIGNTTGWQSQQPLGSFFSSYLFLAVTVAAPALRF